MTRIVKLLLVLTITSACAAKEPSVQEVDYNVESAKLCAKGLYTDAACENFKKSHPDPVDYMSYCSIE
jgi:hypothetical protein